MTWSHKEYLLGTSYQAIKYLKSVFARRNRRKLISHLILAIYKLVRTEFAIC